MPTDPAQYEAAILRLACDVPYFTESQIEGWWPPIDEASGKRSVRKGGPNATLKKLVNAGLLSKEQAPTVTMDYHRECICWMPGESPPNFQAAADHLHRRVAHFQRRTWMLGPQYELSDARGLIPAAQLVLKHHDAYISEAPKNLAYYQATSKAIVADGQTTISVDQLRLIVGTFANQRPSCECYRELRSAWRDDIVLNAITRGLAVSSLYLDKVALGRKVDPSTEFAGALPVAFERTWQSLGQFDVPDITPDAIQFLPPMQPMAVAVSVWCKHAVEAFHRTCEHFNMGYSLY